MSTTVVPLVGSVGGDETLVPGGDLDALTYLAKSNSLNVSPMRDYISSDFTPGPDPSDLTMVY